MRRYASTLRSSRLHRWAGDRVKLGWKWDVAAPLDGGDLGGSQARPTCWVFIKGRTNSSAQSWHRSALLTRTIFARKVLTEDLPAARSFSGAEGISSVSRPEGERFRRVAMTAPPALTSSTEVKSRKSFPFSSIPRANTGMARGILSQRRRSSACLKSGTQKQGLRINWRLHPDFQNHLMSNFIGCITYYLFSICYGP